MAGPIDRLPWLLPWQERFLAAWQQGKAPQGVLLAGAAGVGKRTLARWLAARWSCAAPPEEGAEPCGGCRSCQLAAAEVHPDRFWLSPEPPQREIVIDQVRSLIEAVQITAHGHRRAAVLVPAEAMNRFTANALLKLLEEPPPNLLLLLVSDAPGRLLPTILSRVQRWLITPPEPTEAMRWLVEALKAEAVAATPEQQRQALALTRGAPLAALAHLTQGGAVLIDAFVQDATVTAWRDPVAVAAAWAERLKAGEKGEGWRFADLLRWYRYWLADLVQVAVLGEACRFSRPSLHFPDAYAALNEVAARQPPAAWWQRVEAAAQLAPWVEHPLNLQALCERVWIGYVEGGRG